MRPLLEYLNSLPVAEQASFAQRCGTTVGYLRKAVSVGQLLKAVVCVAIERETRGQVTRKDLRPDDWQDIWPELVESSAECPPALAHQAQVAINSEARQAVREVA